MFKKVLKIIALTVALLLTAVVSVKAITDTVAISDLPEYLNTDTFKLSYSALSDSSVTAQFYVRKDTNSTWTAFGGTQTEASGQVQVTGTQINDGDGLYRFKVQISGAVDETTTTIDRSGPASVQNYWKEQVAGGFYRLHWKNPGDDDLSRVFIYRSTELQFTADGLTKVGELGGGPDNEMTWDNVGLDSNKTYYYALRAVDKAGNASGIVSDPETQVTVLGATAQVPAEEEVVTLPREEEEVGQVLGEEEKVVEAEEKVSGEPVDVLEEVAGVVTAGRRRIIWFVAIVFVLGLAYYFFRRRKKKL